MRNSTAAKFSSRRPVLRRKCSRLHIVGMRLVKIFVAIQVAAALRGSFGCAGFANAADGDLALLASAPFASPCMYTRIPSLSIADLRIRTITVAPDGKSFFVIPVHTRLPITSYPDETCYLVRNDGGPVTQINAADANAFPVCRIGGWQNYCYVQLLQE